MRRTVAAASFVLVGAAVLAAGAGRSTDASQAVRAPALAGQFYPEDARALRAALDGFFRDAVAARVTEPVALVVPHAGYIYSG